LAKNKIFNGGQIIEIVRIVTSILIVEREVGPQVPPLTVEVVVAESIVVAIIDEAGFFPCLETIIARMTHITANLAHHVCVHNLGGLHVARCLQYLHEEVHLSSDHVNSVNLVYTAGAGLETVSIPTLICHHFSINSLAAGTCSKKKAPPAATSRCLWEVRLIPW
jgi:hypothetical protein